jgi:hypothetical protein
VTQIAEMGEGFHKTHVIPAKAGIHFGPSKVKMDSRVRGNDDIENSSVTHIAEILRIQASRTLPKYDGSKRDKHYRNTMDPGVTRIAEIGDTFHNTPVMPAKAGIHFGPSKVKMDSRVRGNDDSRSPRVPHFRKAQ